MFDEPRSTDVWYNFAGCQAAYCAVGAPDPLSARQNVRANFASPGVYAAVPGVAPTWAARTGWGFSEGTNYLTTTYNITTGSGISVLIRFSNVSNSTGTLCGTQLTTSFRMETRVTSTHIYRNGGTATVAGALADGIMTIAGQTGYLNGAYDSAITQGIGNAGVLLIAALNNSGTPLPRLTGNIQSVAIYSRTLTAAEVWQASLQMKYCDVNPDWSPWSVKRRYWYAAAFEAPPAGGGVNGWGTNVGWGGPEKGWHRGTGWN